VRSVEARVLRSDEAFDQFAMAATILITKGDDRRLANNASPRNLKVIVKSKRSIPYELGVADRGFWQTFSLPFSRKSA
jgi:hypothetical protein